MRRAPFGRHLVPVGRDMRPRQNPCLGIVDRRGDQVGELARAEFFQRRREAQQVIGVAIAPYPSSFSRPPRMKPKPSSVSATSRSSHMSGVAASGARAVKSRHACAPPGW